MKIFLINRENIQVFCQNRRLPIYKENGREYVELGDIAGENGTLHLVRRSEFALRGWLGYVLIFWIIGILGIFTPKYSKFTHQLDCKLLLYENQDMKLRFTHFLSEGSKMIPAVTILDNGTAQLEGEFYLRDRAAQRRRKLYQLFSWLTRLIMIILIVVIAIK